MTADRGDALPDGARRLRFVGAGCGPLWVRGFSDADGSGTASKGDVFCAGAGGDGSLEVNLGTQGEVQCRIERRAHVTPP
jgi:hypothetical protein